MFGLGTGELIVLLAVGLLLFGNRLPGIARSLGKSLVEFKKEANNLQDDLRQAIH